MEPPKGQNSSFFIVNLVAFNIFLFIRMSAYKKIIFLFEPNFFKGWGFKDFNCLKQGINKRELKIRTFYGWNYNIIVKAELHGV